ncbi:MAG: CehA/McbA family metallohydrolase [Bacteroidota bacterium]|nr:CehA/McbA family metallohydrolase [Bacteroidota bacterium]
MKTGTFFLLLIGVLPFIPWRATGQQLILDSQWHHLRNTGAQEWTEFAGKAEASRLQLAFSSSVNDVEHTLSFRQYDIKQRWRVILNGQALGVLIEDEKDLMAYLRIPRGALQRNNTLEISSDDPEPDDIRVGEITLHALPPDSLLSQAHIEVNVVEKESQQGIPCRLTIVNGRGILQTVSAKPADKLAVRPGYVYTPTGTVTLGVPAGNYTVYVTRGFEYGVDSARIALRIGDTVKRKFTLAREVSTTGWAASDTHIHTYTWSKHGDATAAERVLTIAGEGIELPVITDHNIHVNLEPYARAQELAAYFTLVTGNEVTTRVGHFNIFPVSGEMIANHNALNWKTLGESMGDPAGSTAIILNHARDIHLGFRPFDPSMHLAAAGMRLDDWEFPANAMEVMNSGSQQSDQLELMRDWFGMLNGGHIISPAGASDSHDVSRFIVGQARTYIRCNDDEPGAIDVAEAVKNFIDGNVMVSFGLLAEIEINDAYGPGEIVPSPDEVKVSVKVSGPSWARAEKIVLYANGKQIRQENIGNEQGSAEKAGVKWSADWSLTLPRQDVFLVAMADGPSDALPYWPIAKPFQPVSRDWNPRLFAVSGAVWLDGDKNGIRNTARDYAQTIVRQAGPDMKKLMQNLASFDESVAIQAAALLFKEGKDLQGAVISQALLEASPETQSSFSIVIGELAARSK